MKIELSIPPGPETRAALQNLEEFREKSYERFVTTDPSRVRNKPFRLWGEQGLPQDVYKEIQDGRITQEHIWKSWIHDSNIADGASPSSHRFARVWTIAWVATLSFFALPLALSVPQTTTPILVGALPTAILIAVTGLVLGSWAESAADLDLEVVQEHHDFQRIPFENMVRELSESYANDLRGEGYEVFEAITDIGIGTWSTRYTAVNGEVILKGDLGRETITTITSKAHLRPKWGSGSAGSTLDFGTVLDLDGNPIVPVGMTTRGVWA